MKTLKMLLTVLTMTMCGSVVAAENSQRYWIHFLHDKIHYAQHMPKHAEWLVDREGDFKKAGQDEIFKKLVDEHCFKHMKNTCFDEPIDYTKCQFEGFTDLHPSEECQQSN